MTTPTTQRLRRTNVMAAALHAVSAVTILILANSFALPVSADFMAGAPGSTARQLVTFFSIPMAGLVAAFFLLSALAHAVVAGPLRSRYEANLARQRNPYRWVEYSLSSSLMIVAIAQLTGIRDVAALLALAGVNAAMIGFGWLQEHYEQPGGSLLPFWLGCGAGVVPWLAIGIYLVGPGAHVHAPGFVYGIYVSLFVFFNCFALVQYLQYRQIGRFRNYVVGESTYLVLSLVAKSLLAWQIFASTLAASTPGH
ncbi:MAG: heliorhodopsin HeR [Acidimicrobiaceae bacterium]|nr:heliorhodopsin HeR [Acidimicrobiaceae bacterium]